MATQPGVDPLLASTLRSIYEEIRWLAGRPGVTTGMARAWYASIRAEPLKRKLRRFSGYVSENAASATPETRLVLEHYGRMHWSISAMINRHLEEQIEAPDEFVQAVIDLERVHVVIETENSKLRTVGGDYAAAGVHLIHWDALDTSQRNYLWSRTIRGKVANAAEFRGRVPCPASRSD